jgi:hypothetical protein
MISYPMWCVNKRLPLGVVAQLASWCEVFPFHGQFNNVDLMTYLRLRVHDDEDAPISVGDACAWL